MPRLFRHTFTAAALAALFAVSHPAAQTTERFTAAAVNMNFGGSGRGATHRTLSPKLSPGLSAGL